MWFDKLRLLLSLSLLISCSSNKSEDSIYSQVAYIDSIVKAHNSVLSRVKTDTARVGNDYYYTSYFYDNRKTLQFIEISEPSAKLNYLSHFHNDSLIKVSVESRSPNYSSDEAAAYYLKDDSIFYKKEPRGKLEDVHKLIPAQKENAIKFNHVYKQQIVL